MTMHEVFTLITRVGERTDWPCVPREIDTGFFLLGRGNGINNALAFLGNVCSYHQKNVHFALYILVHAHKRRKGSHALYSPHKPHQCSMVA